MHIRVAIVIFYIASIAKRMRNRIESFVTVVNIYVYQHMHTHVVYINTSTVIKLAVILINTHCR